MINSLRNYLQQGDKKSLSESIADLSQRTGISERNIYRIISGKINPRLSTLRSISDATGLALDKIVSNKPAA